MKKNNLRIAKNYHLITKSALYITTVLLLAVSFMPLVSSSIPTPRIYLPDEPVTMTAYDSDVSYFDIYLSDVPPDFDVVNGYYMGWCADRSVWMPRGKELTVQLYNSYDALVPLPLQEKNWSQINYILNHKGDTAKSDLQDAFWYLLSGEPYSSLTSTAKMLVDNAEGWFIPQPGDIIAILAAPVHNDARPWPFQFAFLQVRLPLQEPTELEEPIHTPTIRSHGFHYNDLTPIANTNGPYNASKYQVIEFNGSASYDPDGLLIHYKWSFGDGTTAEGKTATHYYTHPGSYQITLTVIDNLGISDTDRTNATIIVPNRPPTHLIIHGPSNGSKNTDYAYVFGAFDEDHDPITYRIDWGDGTTNQTELLPSGHYFGFLHQWDTSGTFTITVTASDGIAVAAAEKDVSIHETLITDNLCIIGLALLALIALLAILLYAKKAKKKK